jgi:hypothetical protein
MLDRLLTRCTGTYLDSGILLKSLLAGAVALPREFGAGLRVAGWHGSLPLGGAVRGRDGRSGAGGGAGLGRWARAARDAGATWDTSPLKSLAPGP